MGFAQLLVVDEVLQCPTENGILGTKKPPSDICKKNQDLKDAIGELRYSTSEVKRSRVNELRAACNKLSDMLGCYDGGDGIP